MKVIAKKIIHNNMLDESKNNGLTIGVVYYVVGIDSEYYRILNDYSEPVLYKKILFEIYEEGIDENWLLKKCSDGEWYCDPPELSEAGFYEDYFDGNSEAIEIFKRYVLRNC